MPTNEDLLDDFELTKEAIKEDDLDSFKMKMASLILADSRLFFKVLFYLGYDL